MHKNRFPCTDCGALSPETATPYTLISQQHGWRVVLEQSAGERIPVWRCPECWAAYKTRRDRDAEG